MKRLIVNVVLIVLRYYLSGYSQYSYLACNNHLLTPSIRLSTYSSRLSASSARLFTRVTCLAICLSTCSTYLLTCGIYLCTCSMCLSTRRTRLIILTLCFSTPVGTAQLTGENVIF